jgi:creatinine amidohydrolase/Fe(II)-dependent formamide hydrolase-like protein
MPVVGRSALDLVALQAQQAHVCEQLLTGVGKGLYDAAFSSLVLVLGFGGAFQYFAMALLTRAYREHGDTGMANARAVIDCKLAELHRACDQVMRHAPQQTASQEN